MEITKIAFIGTGVMGTSIVKHLLESNYEVAVYTRTKEKANSLLKQVLFGEKQLEQR